MAALLLLIMLVDIKWLPDAEYKNVEVRVEEAVNEIAVVETEQN